MKILTTEEMTALLEEHKEWTLVKGKIERDWTFSSFTEAMLFVNRVAAVAEAIDHHPDFDIRYNKVRLSLISHDVKGITKRDAAMIRELDRNFSPKT